METESYMSSGLYKAAAARDVGYLSSETVSEERKERLIRDLLCLTREGSNCLHVAARSGRVNLVRFRCDMYLPFVGPISRARLKSLECGHEEFVRSVLSHCPSLLYQRNKREDNPLHVAARAGDLRLVKLFTHSFQHHQPPQNSQSTESAGNREIAGEGNQENCTNLTDSVQCLVIAQSQSVGDNMISERSLREAEEGERPSRPIIRGSTQNQESIQPHPPSSQSESPSEWPSMPIWRTQNQDGNTALHEALCSKHEDVAIHLLDLDLDLDSELAGVYLDSKLAVLVVNAKDESPMYLAAEAGFVSVLLKILGAGGTNNTVGPMGLTPLHAAVFSQKAGCIEALHKSIPELIRKQDPYGKAALYYAAQENCIEVMRVLLKLDASSAYICDNEGRSPLLAAASMGNHSTVKAYQNNSSPTPTQLVESHLNSTTSPTL